MNNLIKEEVNRIREVMGLKLLTESPIPAGFLRSLFSDLANKAGKDLNAIIKSTNAKNKKIAMDNLINNFRTGADQSANNFINSVDEIAAELTTDKNPLTSAKLLDDIINGKVDDKIQEDLISKMAAKSAGVDINLFNILQQSNEDIANLYNNVNTIYTGQGLESLKQKLSTPEGIAKAKKFNEDLLEQLNGLEEGSFKTELKQIFEKQLEYVDENFSNVFGTKSNFSKGISNLADEYGISTDVVPKEKLDVIGKNLDGAIRKYVLTRGVKGNPDDIVKEIRSKLISQMDEKFTKGLGFDNQKLVDEAEKMFEDPKMLESIKQKMIETADKTLVPVYKMTDWGYWKNFIRGYNPSTGKLKGDTLGKQIFNWYLNTTKFAFFAALAEMIITAAKDPEQLAGKEGDIADKILDRIGGWGPLLQALTPFGAGRLLSFFYGAGDYDSLIVYPAQMSEYLKQTNDIDVKPDDLQIIPNASEYDGTTYEKETVSLVKNKVNGDVYGLFTYDDKTNKVVDVQTIKDSTPQTTTKYGTGIDEFKKFLNDKKEDITDAVDDSDNSGFYTANGKKYEYNDDTKTYDFKK
jgi:hypothetical protein